jgi:hypothetical protein
METEPGPKLAPPGAGLPKVELWIARRLFQWQFRRGNRAIFNERFQRERIAIQALIATCTAGSGGRRVLIQRVPGLEDSSRYWSVWMTLDHLRIMHVLISRTIGSLAKGVALAGQASTAAVKPDPKVTQNIVTSYEQSCDTLLKTVAGIPELKTVARYTHPWFGPLDAAGWHAMAAMHIAIHRTQIQRIIQGLPPSG